MLDRSKFTISDHQMSKLHSKFYVIHINPKIARQNPQIPIRPPNSQAVGTLDWQVPKFTRKPQKIYKYGNTDNHFIQVVAQLFNKSAVLNRIIPSIVTRPCLIFMLALTNNCHGEKKTKRINITGHRRPKKTWLMAKHKYWIHNISFVNALTVCTRTVCGSSLDCVHKSRHDCLRSSAKRFTKTLTYNNSSI